MKNKIIKTFVLVFISFCVIGIGAYVGLNNVEGINNTKHYVGFTEMPLTIANALYYNNDYNGGEKGTGDVHINSVSCPSGNVMVYYDFKTTRNYEYLDIGYCSHTGDIAINIALSTMLTIFVIVFFIYVIWYGN